MSRGEEYREAKKKDREKALLIAAMWAIGLLIDVVIIVVMRL